MVNLKSEIGSAIKRIAEKHKEDIDYVILQTTMIVGNKMFFHVFGKVGHIRTKKEKLTWELSDILGISKYMMLSGYLSTTKQTLEDVFEQICKDNKIEIEDTLVLFQQQGIEINKFMLKNKSNSSLDKPKLIDFNEFKIT